METITNLQHDVIEKLLPTPFQQWFAKKGWHPRAHQLSLLQIAKAGDSALLIAPTGAGKTLAGFLPALTTLAKRPKPLPGEARRGIFGLYISPLKALATDVKRNVEAPIAEMGLPIRVETRTGDTPQNRRQRQKLNPPDLLMTTPEQLSLLLAMPDAERFFADLQFVIFDELHSLVTNKRGHLLSLALARLWKLRPGLQTIGLSATISNPLELQQWLVPQNQTNTGTNNAAKLVQVAGGTKPDITILDTKERLPWSGHSGKHAAQEVYDLIKEHKTTLLFVNTRSQAEFLFQHLWRINENNLPIALHHGALDVAQRRKVEAAMSENKLRAVIATSTLDLGIDWGDVDLVVHLGAPKGASRLAQRIGRANHRMDEPSKAVLVPANRFEVLECKAALDANYLGDQDTPPLRTGALDVLCQHILAMAVAAPFQEDELYAEITNAAPYADLDRDTFERCIQFVATGGYALKAYERYAKIRRMQDGTWQLTHPRFAQQYRMNSGTIYEIPALKIRLVRQGRKNGKLPATRGGRILGQLDEYFLAKLNPGDTFMFSGEIVRLEGFQNNEAIVTRTQHSTPMVPSYTGSKFPLSTYLAIHVRKMISNPDLWKDLPFQVSDWLRIQAQRSIIPQPHEVLVETFPRANKHYLITYAFEGQLAHQTLAMLLTKRLERAGAKPTGFVATDYVVAIWGLEDMGALIAEGALDLQELYNEDMLGDDLETWMADSMMLKRTFRQCALIAGLIDKNQAGSSKTGRQMTQSSDLIYDVLREHEPDHILLQATRDDAATGLLDVRRVGDLLTRAKGNIIHKHLDRLSPMAVPIMLEKGVERVSGSAAESLLAEAAENLIAEAMTV